MTQKTVTLAQVIEEWRESDPEVGNLYGDLLNRFGDVVGHAVQGELQGTVPANKLRSLVKQLNGILDNIERHVQPASAGKVGIANAASRVGHKAVAIVYDKNGMPKIDNPVLFKQKYPEVWSSFTAAQRAFLGD